MHHEDNPFEVFMEVYCIYGSTVSLFCFIIHFTEVDVYILVLMMDCQHMEVSKERNWVVSLEIGLNPVIDNTGNLISLKLPTV